MGRTAKNFGLTINACCEKADLSKYNIERASCIDKTVIERVCGYRLNLEADKNQREGCGCIEGIDIGSYNTCLNGCIYCYANNGTALCERRHSLHNPSRELLIGTVTDGEKITERKVKSFRMD